MKFAESWVIVVLRRKSPRSQDFSREVIMSFARKNIIAAAVVSCAAVGLAFCQAASVSPPAKKSRPVARPIPAQNVPARSVKIPAKPKPPFALFGPPLPRERAFAAQQAERLRGFLKTGRLRFANPERDGQQLFCVARDGLYLWPPETPQAIASASFVPASEAPRPQAPLSSRYGVGTRIRPPAPEDVPAEKTPVAPLPPPPDPHLMETLAALAAHSAPSRPLEILSLFRPPYRTAYWRHGGPGTLHSHGMAVDIGAYGGHSITQSDPEGCVLMTLALLRDLPPGSYRLGLPKAPDAPLVVGHVFLSPSLDALVYPQAGAGKGKSLRPSRRGKGKPANPPLKSALPVNSAAQTFAILPAALGIEAGCPPVAWPFFPAPQPEIKDGVIAATKPNGSQAHIVRFQNEAYAPAEALADVRLRDAIKRAAKRGAFIIGLFPDGADHIHLDVKSKK